ncbi:MAG: CocE/NonD family hydrolase [Thermoanaerobaculia bacterium]|nr:CocE/NonD family hydrolase [Thermoanaerobaculia bacterium]
MSVKRTRAGWCSTVGAVALLTFACAPAPEPGATGDDEPRSGFGAYESPEAAIFDGWNRYSQYVPAEDGTKLAVDVFLPTRDGVEPSEPVPVVLHYTRYIRALELEDGTVAGRERDPVLQHLLRHGYAIAAADARGTGASYGVHHGAFSVEETKDSHAIIQWLASQPWCNGRVGMSGRSYPGMTQYQATTQSPPALKAIFAEMAGPSAYDFIYRGGAMKKDFIDVWGAATQAQDLGESGVAARVDTDVEGVMRDDAIAEHAANLWARDLIAPGSNLRNFELDREGGGHWSWEKVIATIDDADTIADSGIGIYHLVGWYDIYTTQQPWLYATLDGRSPQKMMIGPWVHSGGYGGAVHKAEILRWYDYWLKGIDNGVMDEAPVHYYVMKGNHTLPGGGDWKEGEAVAPTFDEAAAEDGGAWVAATEWPPTAEKVRFWLDDGDTGTVASVNDGVLRMAAAAPAAGADAYTVDYSSRMGTFSRWMNGYGARREEPAGSTYFDERSTEDAKALTYTTEPLTEDLTLVGYPVVELWVTSSHDDGDFFAYLEEIDAEGRSHYVSEGVLRASHRKTSTPPFDNLGLPFHRSYPEDIAKMKPGEPTQLAFDLMGTAIVIDAGHRIRITIAGADARNFQLHPDPNGKDAPDIEVLRGGETASYVELPVLAGAE